MRAWTWKGIEGWEGGIDSLNRIMIKDQRQASADGFPGMTTIGLSCPVRITESQALGMLYRLLYFPQTEVPKSDRFSYLCSTAVAAEKLDHAARISC